MLAASETKTRLRATSDPPPPADPHPPACAAASASNLDIATAGAGMTATLVLYFRHEGRRHGIASHGHHPSRRGPRRAPAFGPRMVCARRGIVGADSRPNWRERIPQPPLVLIGLHNPAIKNKNTQRPRCHNQRDRDKLL
jgi:hypothetical protein